MKDNTLHDTAIALQQEWGLELPLALSEEALLQLLASRIVAILQQGPDTFYQLMYRLDISEKKLNAITGDQQAAIKIAKLIYDRQLQKIQSRRENKMSPPGEDAELKW